MNEFHKPEHQAVNPEQRSKIPELLRETDARLKGTTQSVETESKFDNPKLVGVEKIATKHCGLAQEIAKASPDNGAYFTEHGLAHWLETEVKSSEIADAVETAVSTGKIYKEGYSPDETRVPFAEKIDRDVLSGAALSHDTGMSDHGYSLKEENGRYIIEPQNSLDFDSVRSNHTLNSAINILAARDEYKVLGYTDAQVDTMAVACFAHSKSNSGIRDINSVSDWNEGIKRIAAVKERYNLDHPDKQISFDVAELTNNRERMSELASLSICLRPGDVSRDSGPNAETQSGEKAHVEKKQNYQDTATTWTDEVNGFDIFVGDKLLETTPEMTEKQVNRILKSKQVHIGEQNIVANSTGINENGRIQHVITVNDGNHAPYCTAEAIKDHFGEFASAQDIGAEIRVEFVEACSEDTQEKYNTARNNMYKEQMDKNNLAQVKIIFPWDEV